MNIPHAHPVFGGFLVVLALLGIGEVALALRLRSGAADARERLETKRAELRAIGEMHPYPSAENAAAVAAGLDETLRVLVSMRASVRGSPGVADAILTMPPRSRTDAFFDIAKFAERNRERATTAGVTIDPGERFGFSLYANEGPVPELIPFVHRQKAIVDHLLGILFAAHVRELVSVQREPVQLAGSDGRPDTVETASRDDAAFFMVDPRVTARGPGLVHATGIKITFIGQTGALRNFLNGLAAFELPVIVRCVEVEPLPGERRDRGNGRRALSLAKLFGSGVEKQAVPATRTGPVPIVGRNLSKFTVTVEYVELGVPLAPST